MKTIVICKLDGQRQAFQFPSKKKAHLFIEDAKKVFAGKKFEFVIQISNRKAK